MYTTKDYYKMAEDIKLDSEMPKFHTEEFHNLMFIMLNKLGDDAKKIRQKRVIKVIKAFNRPGTVKDLKQYVDVENITDLFKGENTELLIRDIHEYLDLFDKKLDVATFSKNIK